MCQIIPKILKISVCVSNYIEDICLDVNYTEAICLCVKFEIIIYYQSYLFMCQIISKISVCV